MLCTARAMALIPAPLLRVSILLAYFSVLCAYRAVDIPAQQTYGGSWKFLTYINVVIQTCFFAVAVLGDASKFLHQGGSGLAMDQQLTKLTRLRDRIFTVLAFPIGTFVVIAFWAMYSWDREMVHPEVLDSFIPAWLHHGMHSTVLLFLLLEILMTPHRYPSRAMGLLGTVLFSVAYIGWVLWVQQAAGISVYPLLARLARPVLGALLALAVLAVGCLYVAGEKLDSFVWGREEVNSKSD
ncbi:androgen-induced gene 1 protein isoform X2 [Petromyzon marinus]|uniref:Androgen-induced gene 1 protein isoform X1 n=1 Tax=Petromyzon marinus TaxID=7757 RepID=A0AAJ7U4T1_PETMA|nr:androgen-induced gene 1 protein isoform X1 [Petromyzon marinus]